MPAKKCPVCDWELKDQGKKVKIKDKVVVVCCDDCAKAVKENPSKYIAGK